MSGAAYGLAGRRAGGPGGRVRPTGVPELPGVLSAHEMLATAESIAAVQRPDGMIPWFEGGHCDPWNHVESAMALSVAGLDDEASLGLSVAGADPAPRGGLVQLLPGRFRREGSSARHECLRLCRHRRVAPLRLYRRISDFFEELWPVVDRALGFVLRWQKSDGTVRWSVDPDGRLQGYALLTGSSSIYHALRCGVACAEVLGKERPDWELAAGRIAHAIAHTPQSFEPKDEFAMDWYYPVLTGALEGEKAHVRIDSWWDTFVMEGLGVRCVSTGPWVTAAETAECALALDVAGRKRTGAGASRTGLRCCVVADGSYWTGMVFPEQTTFPFEERTTYTAAAIVLVADALCRATPASGHLPWRGSANRARSHRAQDGGPCVARQDRRPGDTSGLIGCVGIGRTGPAPGAALVLKRGSGPVGEAALFRNWEFVYTDV